MPSLVVPYRGAKGKSRLGLPGSERTVLAEAMLDDVVAACMTVGPTYVVGPMDDPPAEVTLVPDPGGGQGPAVRAGLEVAALAAGGVGPLVVVNADLPCVTPRDLFALAGAVPSAGLALTAAADGTTNALALARPGLFVPLYGPGSAARFAALAPSRRVDAPNLIDDVDTLADLERLRKRLGPHTRSVLTSLRFGAAA
ncbi:MAG TPA: NTP transferase domain-containing protein [Gaiellaceae bacterium]|jgi:2-phospho-L-lactate guanylyltransferase (CobY/MobA/RfbA family)|nr:NTP transferase domain-containing protein [Gaiellaceae bacterium]